jgi:hypothetical protein
MTLVLVEENDTCWITARCGCGLANSFVHFSKKERDGITAILVGKEIGRQGKGENCLRSPSPCHCVDACPRDSRVQLRQTVVLYTVKPVFISMYVLF